MDIKLSKQRRCLPTEAMKKSSVNTIDEVSHQYDHYNGKLRERDSTGEEK